MDEDVTALSLHCHEPKIIFHGTGKQTLTMVKHIKLVLYDYVKTFMYNFVYSWER